jgi:ppGpp synthetase/RelA/SpoT-type nucleotidyltranferase
MSASNPKSNKLDELYRHRHDAVLVTLAANLSKHIQECLDGQSRIDRISARAKSVDRFLKKAETIEDGKAKYSEPLDQIQDQIGARVIVFYKADVDRIDGLIRKYFAAIEYRTVVPDSEDEFSYFGRHLILKIPGDVVERDMDASLVPGFFELQIKTLFQHAWSEADHDLGYKPGETELTADQKRLVALASAQAWGSDHIFDQLARERAII